MKYELIDKTGKDFSAELGGINDEKIESGKKIKKDELKEIGFIFNTDADRNYWLADHPEETIRINISVDGTMVATKTNNTEFTLTEKQKVDTVVKKMYGLLGVNESEYNAIE